MLEPNEPSNNPFDSCWISLIENSKVPSITSLKDRPIEKDDYSNYKSNLDVNLKALICFVKEHSKKLEEIVEPDEFLVSLVVIIFEQTQKGQWTTESEVLQEELKSIYKNFYKTEDVSYMSKLLNLLLKQIKHNLLRDNWKSNPASIQVHQFAINVLLERDLINNDFIHMIFPPLLLQIDDHQSEHKLNGLKSLNTVFSGIDFCLLVKSGLDIVIFEAVKPLLYLPDSEIVRLAVLCLCPIINREKPSTISNNLENKFLKYYDVLEIVLSNMIVTSASNARRMYTEVLPVILKSIRNGIYPWINRLQEIYDHYLDTCVIDNYVDEEILFNTIYCIMVTYDYFKPFAKPIFEDLVDIMLLLLLRFTEGTFVRDKVVSEKLLKALVIAISILLKNNDIKLLTIVNNEMFAIYANKFPLYNQQWKCINRLIHIENNLPDHQKTIIPSEKFLYYLQIKYDEIT